MKISVSLVKIEPTVIAMQKAYQVLSKALWLEKVTFFSNKIVEHLFMRYTDAVGRLMNTN